MAAILTILWVRLEAEWSMRQAFSSFSVTFMVKDHASGYVVVVRVATVGIGALLANDEK